MFYRIQFLNYLYRIDDLHFHNVLCYSQPGSLCWNRRWNRTPQYSCACYCTLLG